MSGSEKEIKALKERFIRGKTIPPLSNIDIHVICGCIKDFLRSLREPIIPTDLWKNFSNAVQNVDDSQAVKDLYTAINLLPKANRDTLAFLIQHLQRYVGEQNYHGYLKLFLSSSFPQFTAWPFANLLKCRYRTCRKSLVQLFWGTRVWSQINMRFSPKP